MGGTVGTVRAACAACGRTVVESGAVYLIEAARVRDGREPASEFLDGLVCGKKKDLERLADLMVRFEE